MPRNEYQDIPEINRRSFLAASATATAAGVFSQPRAGGSAVDARPDEIKTYDAVVVGGGPAGLSAALVLGRACLNVLICDAGPGRNAPAEGVHGFLGQDGTPPQELRRIGLDQLKPYNVTHEATEVVAARKTDAGFELTLGHGGRVACPKLILATGVVDILPEIPGLRERWGGGVIHCPYCHGWETRDRPWAFLVAEEAIKEMGSLLRGWTKSLTLLTNGAFALPPETRDWLARQTISVVEDRINRLDGDGKHLDAIHFDGSRPPLAVPTMFLGVRTRQRSQLAEQLGCEFNTEGWLAGTVRTDPAGATAIDGLYVVGDASGGGGPTVAAAVAEGAAAGGAASRTLIIARAAL